MPLLTLLTFVPPVLTGGLLAHLLWSDRQFWSLVFKAFLGVGLGLGVRSLLYFLYLLLFAGQSWFLFVEVVGFAVVFSLALARGRKSLSTEAVLKVVSTPTRGQQALLAIAAIVLAVSLFSTANYLLRRRQGDWDAWMMYNRAARFVYLDQPHWLQSFSPKMDPIFHADYPLLLAMNIASSWETLGRETPYAPMVQSALFSVACAGLLVSALAAVKSIGQAALGLIVFWGIPVVVNEGARQMADIPLAFFVSATGILMYFYVVKRKMGLLVLAGITAGLGAWTKNEGSVLVIGGLVAAVAALVRRNSWRPALAYGVGLVAPLVIVLYFKLHLAPPSDVLSSGLVRSIRQMASPARHMEILQYFWQEIANFGSWGIPSFAIGVLPVLLIFFLVFRAPIAGELRPAFVAGSAILMVQGLGYYAAYLISPYDLAWHLSYSTTRIVLQMFPLLLFLILCACIRVEGVLASAVAQSSEVSHASGD